MRRLLKTILIGCLILFVMLLFFWLQDRRYQAKVSHIQESKRVRVGQPGNRCYQRKTVFVLALPGGGMRGVSNGMLLDYIERKMGKPISDLFPVIAGSSTGGITAALLTLPNKKQSLYTAHDVINFYKNKGPYIFHRTTWHRIVTLDGLTGPRFDASFKRRVFHSFSQGVAMADLRADVILNGYSLKHFSPVIYNAWLARRSPVDDYKVADVLNGITAVSSAFPPVHLKNIPGTVKDVVADGVLYDIHPGMNALRFVLEHYPVVNKIVVVTVGLGRTKPEPIGIDESKHWGIIGWLPKIIPVLLRSNTQSRENDFKFLSQSNLKLLFNNRPVTVKYIDMNIWLNPDEAGAELGATPEDMRRFKAAGNMLIQRNQKKLNYLFKMLKSGEGACLQ